MIEKKKKKQETCTIPAVVCITLQWLKNVGGVLFFIEKLNSKAASM
jgi:hypothetical protein